MDYCSHCREMFVEEITEEEFSYSGGILTVTNVPVSICACDSLKLLGDVALITHFIKFLERCNMIGNITITLDIIRSKFDFNETLISEKHDESVANFKLNKQMDWMKEKLALSTTEQLLSKALSFLNMAIELEDRNYTIMGHKNLGLIKAERIVFKIKPL